MKQQADQHQGSLTLYLKECLRLLLWLCFKPFTLQHSLSTLPPISPRSIGLFTMPVQWRRFLNQERGAMTILSLLIGSLYGLCLSFFSVYPFFWLTWIIIELCFGICIWLSVLLQLKGWRLLLIGVLISLIWIITDRK